MAKKEIIIDTRLEGVGRTEQELNSINSKIKQATAEGKSMGASLGSSLKTVQQSAQLAIASFNALNAVLILTNSTSEEMREVLIKIQAVQILVNSAMGIYNSLQGSGNALKVAGATITKAYASAQTFLSRSLGTATVATRGLSAAMLAIPILAIIAGITALVTWIVKLTSASKELEAQNERLVNSFRKLQEASEDWNNHEEKRQRQKIALMKEEGATNEEIYNEEVKFLQLRENNRKEDLKNVERYIDDLEAQWLKARDSRNQDEMDRLQEEMDKASDHRVKLIRMEEDIIHDRKLLDARETNRQNEEAQKRRDNAIRNAQEAKQRRDEIRAKELQEEEQFEQALQNIKDRATDITIQAIEDEQLREEATIGERYEREKRRIIKQFGENTELLKELEANRDAELQQVRDKYQSQEFERETERQRRDAEAFAELRLTEAINEFKNLQEIRAEDLEARISAEKEYLNAMRELELENEDLTEYERLLIKERYAQEEKELEQELAQFKIDLANKEEEEKKKFRTEAIKSVQNLSDIAFSIAMSRAKEGSKEEEKIAKKQFKTNKMLQISMATATGIQTVMEAFKSGMAMPIIGPATGAAYAAMAGIASAANIAKIAATKFGGSGGSVSATMPTAPAVNAPEIVRPDEFDAPEIVNEEREDVRVVLLDSDLKKSENKQRQVDLISRG